MPVWKETSALKWIGAAGEWNRQPEAFAFSLLHPQDQQPICVMVARLFPMTRIRDLCLMNFGVG